MTSKLRDTIDSAISEAQSFDDKKTKQDYVEGVARADGFINTLTGFGTAHDKTAYTRYQLTGGRLDPRMLDDLFRSNDIARRTVALRPYEATRRGFIVQAENAPAINDAIEKMNINNYCRKAMVWARLYGGSVIVIGARDGREPKEPLAENDIDRIDWLRVVSSNWVTRGPLNENLDDPYYALPEYYTVKIGNAPVHIHHSRVIEFGGVLTSDEMRMKNAGWDDSVLQASYDVIKDFATAYSAVSIMLTEANQSVISLQGFIDMLAEGNQETVQKRLQIMNLCRSAARCLILDSESEKYENHELSFAGIALVLDRLMMRLSAAVEIPVTILMGRSPAGENATGDADFRWFYDTIETEQSEVLKPRLYQLLRLMMLAKNGPTKGKIPEQWSIQFNSLWRMTDSEQATLELSQAQRDTFYLDREVITPESVALGRFNEKTAIQIDREAVEESMKEKQEEKVAKLTLTPSDTVIFTTVNEARRASGQGDWPNREEGEMPVNAFAALQEAKIQAMIAKLYGTNQKPSTDTTES